MPTNTISYVTSWAVVLLSLPLTLHAATPVQFIDGLWLSQESIHPQETVRIYVALRNSATVEISGSVAVAVNGEPLATRTITALPGRLIESWVDWTPQTTGDYRITATLQDVTLEHPDGSETVPNHTATLTREAVTVTTPPPPPTTTPPSTSSPTSTTSTNQRLPRWYQSLTQEIQDTHDQLQAYETALSYRQSSSSQPTPVPATRPVNEDATATDHYATTTSTTTAGATLSSIIGNWLSTNLLTAQLWLIRSVRWLFGYPVLVQILLLLSILWATYRVAGYFGRR